MPTVRVGYCPDPDDVFMFAGLTTGKVTIPGITLEPVLADIETLNRRARAGELDATALSVATYALVADRYRLLDAGAAMGKGSGPVLVAREPIAAREIPDRVVAIPGSHTTAALVLRLYLPEEPPLIEVAFEKIPQAVREGQADLGLLIHEGQLTHAAQGLVKVLDLAEAWLRDTDLPLPLGVTVVRRDLAEPTQQALSRGLRASVAWARANADEALQGALRYARGMDRETCRRFVALYVNDYTVALGAEGRAALLRLYTAAQGKGLLPAVPPIDPV